MHPVVLGPWRPTAPEPELWGPWERQQDPWGLEGPGVRSPQCPPGATAAPGARGAIISRSVLWAHLEVAQLCFLFGSEAYLLPCKCTWLKSLTACCQRWLHPRSPPPHGAACPLRPQVPTPLAGSQACKATASGAPSGRDALPSLQGLCRSGVGCMALTSSQLVSGLC